jgi:hypothetical protein
MENVKTIFKLSRKEKDIKNPHCPVTLSVDLSLSCGLPLGGFLHTKRKVGHIYLRYQSFAKYKRTSQSLKKK